MRKITKKDTKKIIDIMTKPREVKLIAPTKAINDALMDCQVKGLKDINQLPEIQKDIIRVMAKYKLFYIQASLFKKWSDDIMFGVPKV